MKASDVGNFYACDYCKNNAITVFLETCHCRAYGMEHVAKKVVHDGQSMLEACEKWERREKAE